MAFLEGKKVILRPVTREDLRGPYSDWINNRQTDVFTEHAEFPHTVEDLERYYQQRSSSSSHVWLAIVERQSNKHVGNIELSEINWIHRKAKFAILVGDPDAQGKGLGFEASELLFDHAFSKLNLHRIEIGVHVENRASIAYVKKLGFVEEGRLREAFTRKGAFHDIVILSLLSPYD